MHYQIEGYSIRQCILKAEIHIGEPKTYLITVHFFPKEKRQKLQIHANGKCKYVHFITFPDEFEILKKVASNLKRLVLWRNLDLHNNIDKRWKANRKLVLISHKLEHFIFLSLHTIMLKLL